MSIVLSLQHNLQQRCVLNAMYFIKRAFQQCIETAQQEEVRRRAEEEEEEEEEARGRQRVQLACLDTCGSHVLCWLLRWAGHRDIDTAPCFLVHDASLHSA